MTHPTERETVRAETGPMEFPGDWPGVFIRGDNAMAYAIYLETVISQSVIVSPYLPAVRGLVKLLRSCDARENPVTTKAILKDKP